MIGTSKTDGFTKDRWEGEFRELDPGAVWTAKPHGYAHIEPPVIGAGDMTNYAFGDSDLAARRLEVLAETFAESSSEFMRRSVKTRPRLAVDLGCGPGYSTQLLASILNPEHTAGLDNSEKFLVHAKTRASTSVSFHLHDITKTPFPTGLCDVMFSRFELTHLANPEELIGLWVDQLQPLGRLLIEEVEYIDTANPILIRYLDVLQIMLRQQDGELYIGSRLDSVLDPNRVRRESNGVHALEVPMRRAALMFLMNIRAWSGQEFVRREFGSATLDELEDRLGAIAEGVASAAPVEWGLRQMVLSPTGAGSGLT